MIVAHVSMKAVARTMVHATGLCRRCCSAGVLGAKEIDGMVGRRADDRHEHDSGAHSNRRIDQVHVALAVDGLRRHVAAAEAVHRRDDDIHAGNSGRQAGRVADVSGDDLTCGPASCEAGAGRRVSTRTGSPRSVRRRTSILPRVPVPPATRITNLGPGSRTTARRTASFTSPPLSSTGSR